MSHSHTCDGKEECKIKRNFASCFIFLRIKEYSRRQISKPTDTSVRDCLCFEEFPIKCHGMAFSFGLFSACPSARKIKGTIIGEHPSQYRRNSFIKIYAKVYVVALLAASERLGSDLSTMLI